MVYKSARVTASKPNPVEDCFTIAQIPRAGDRVANFPQGEDGLRLKERSTDLEHAPDAIHSLLPDDT